MNFEEELFKLFMRSGEIVSLLSIGVTQSDFLAYLWLRLVNVFGGRLAGIEFAQFGKVGFGSLGLIQLRHWKINIGQYSAM